VSISSARPDALVAYPTRTAPVLDAADRATYGIDEVIGALRASSGGYLPLESLYGLEREVRATLARVRAIDQRVGDIGRAFLHADEGGGGIRTMPDRKLARESAGVPTWLLDFVVADLFNIWDGRSGGTPYGKLGAGGLQVLGAYKWLGRADEARRAGDLAEGPGRWAIHAHRSFPTVNNSLAMNAFARTGSLPSVTSWMTAPGTTALLRKAGVAGGVWSTASDVKNVMDQGNPIDAYRREGAGYVADIARTGFSASSTAFLYTPTPVTAGAMLATGVVWAGAEVWDHWGDDISTFVDETWDAGWGRAAGAADTVGSTVADAWTDATDSVSNAWDDASNVVSDISKGADLATGAVGTVVSNVADRLPSFSW
jgi:hypothetical protein